MARSAVDRGARPLRLGLAGAGPWGRNYVRTLSALPEARLVAIASRNPETAALAANDCAIVGDWRGLLDRELDGIIIATPPSTHLEIAATAVGQGLAALIEKPLCLDLEEAVRFRAMTASSRAAIVVNHIHLFSPAYRHLKSLLPALGPVRRIESAGGRRGPFRADTPALWDWGPHDISMCLDLLGCDPVRIAANRSLRQPEQGGWAENYALELEFPGPILAQVKFGNLLDPVRRFAVVFDGTTLVYDDLAAHKLMRWDGGNAGRRETERGQYPEISGTSPLQVAIQEFCHAIRTGSTCIASLDLAVRVTRLLEQIHRQSDRQIH